MNRMPGPPDPAPYHVNRSKMNRAVPLISVACVLLTVIILTAMYRWVDAESGKPLVRPGEASLSAAVGAPNAVKNAASPAGGAPWLGIVASDPAPGQGTLAVGQRGALVTEVKPASPAFAAGIRKGDLIRRLGGTRIRNTAALASALGGAAPGTKVVLTVHRGTRVAVIPVTLGRSAGTAAGNTPTTQPSAAAVNPVAAVNTSRGAVAVLTDAKGHTAPALPSPMVTIIDAGGKTVRTYPPLSNAELLTVLRHNGIPAVVCGQADPATATTLGNQGITVYSGVWANARDAAGFYRSGRLTPMRLQ